VQNSPSNTPHRLLAAGLVPLTAAPFIGGSLSPVLDAVFCATLLTHSYIGFQASIIDYFPQWRTPKTRSALMWALRISTVGVGVALYEFETSTCGVVLTYQSLDRC
jgi:succinate dehydrogenase (ubiquinone) membrane anchor subunit